MDVEDQGYYLRGIDNGPSSATDHSEEYTFTGPISVGVTWWNGKMKISNKTPLNRGKILCYACYYDDE